VLRPGIGAGEAQLHQSPDKVDRLTGRPPARASAPR
jgi:hypothetical protein